MGDLTKQLLEAGLINEKQAKKAKHDKRMKRAKVGDKGLEAEERKRDEAHREKRAQRSEADRERNRAAELERLERVSRDRLRDLVRSNTIGKDVAGNRRYYFVARDNKVPFVEVSDAAVRRLQHGDLGIVEVPDQSRERFAILARNHALQVHATAPELVRVLHG